MWSVVAVLPHPPIFTQPLNNKTAYVGDNVTFRCVVLSDLLPHIAWVKHYQVNGSYMDVNDSWYLTIPPPVSRFALVNRHKPSGRPSVVRTTEGFLHSFQSVLAQFH